MATFEDSITIRRSAPDILSLLSDLERHASFVPEGFKRYRILSRETSGVGARAALELNLLGHWLPGELEIARADASQVDFRIRLAPVELRLHFHLVARGPRTEVRLSVDHDLRRLPPWRIRTRIKQRLRLTQDIRVLHSRFLSILKKEAEESAPSADASTDETSGRPPFQGETSTTNASPHTGRSQGPQPSSNGAPGGGGNASRATPTDGAGRMNDENRQGGETPSNRPAAAANHEQADTEQQTRTSTALPRLGPGQARIMKAHGRDVAVFNVDGCLYAIDNACPHRGGSLGFGVLEGTIVTCPLHGWTFDVTNGRCTLIEGVHVQTYPVTVEDGQVRIGEASSSA